MTDTPYADDPTVKFSAAYEGKALEGGRMQATLFGPALFHLSSLVERSAAIVYQDCTPLRVEISANLREGSFEFELLAGVTLVLANAQATMGALTMANIDQLLEWIGIKGDGTTGLLGLLKRFGTPKVVAAAKDPAGLYTVSINTTGDGNIVVVNAVPPEVLRLLRDQEVRAAAVDTMAPLKHPGIDGFRIGTDPKSQMVHFDRVEARAIERIEGPKRALADDEAETALEVVAPNFDDDNKWKVRQGEAPFWVRISDTEFNRSVTSGRAFRKGDYLIVRMRQQSFATDSGITTEREVVKVLRHEQREVQGDLLDAL